MSVGEISAELSGRRGAFELDVAFTTPMRGVTALFGPSGCGKTTVLRCIAGLDPLRGRLQVGETVWQDTARGIFQQPHTREIGYVFQEASLFDHLSVGDNLMFGRRRAEKRNGRSKTESLSSDEVIDLLGLEPLLDRDPYGLSGGERQRVAVGRALLSYPKVLLMDEPLSALDRRAKEEILPYFDALHQRLDIPILYVSHDPTEVARLADQIVLMGNGRIIATGPVSEVFERLDLGPATGRFEAGAVVSARVREHMAEDSLTRLCILADTSDGLRETGQFLSLPSVNAAVGEDLRLRIRARDVALATRRPEGLSIRNVLSGHLTEIVEDPGTAFAETLVDIGGARLRARITRAAVRELRLQTGDPVFALVKTISFDGRAIGAGGGLEPAAWRTRGPNE
ncbi:MAG: molybdenum ABC transporter ATP-binding protein [Neomegalonema sp.]